MAVIALLTDFGDKDWFVGAVKGVIAGIAPRAQVIDITHGVAPGDVRAGAFALWAAFRAFPKGTIFAAVVDPGVGGPRRALLVEAHGYRFLGPDNGLLSWAADDSRRRARTLENPRYRLPEVSASFHGRDVFAPAAAHLALGARASGFGKALTGIAEIPRPVTRKVRGAVRGEILHVDRFGNAVTNIPAAEAAEAETARCRGRAFPMRGYYAAAAPGKPLALVGSCGLVELSLNGGDAASRFSLRIGDSVSLA
jgi:S-adenosylmethionine hydrolase